MISETTFCSHHSSIWRMIAPTCDLFVRRLNDGLYERFDKPIETGTDPARRALVNEVAFSLFCSAIENNDPIAIRQPSKERLERAVSTAQSNLKKIQNEVANLAHDLEEPEIADAVQQFHRLWRELTSKTVPKDVIVRPHFKGCGIIDSCRGDVALPGMLYEIKAGERKFRSIDFRQILTYCALNSVYHGFRFSSVGLMNPRVGIRFEIDLDELCFEISGRPSSDFLSEVVRLISSGDISR